MKARSFLSWAIVLAVVLTACRKEDMLPLYDNCPLCEKVAGSYELILVETSGSSYCPVKGEYIPLQPITGGELILSEFGEFRRVLDVYSIDTVHASKATMNHCVKSYIYEPVSDSVMRIWYDQCSKSYYTYATIRDSILIHETGYQKWMTYKRKSD